MKEVLAVIRINKMNQTKKALSEAGISSMTAAEALGRGQGLVDFKTLEGAQQGYQEAIEMLGSGQRLIPKRLVSIIVPDKLVKKTVDVIIKTNQTGKPGDGKIFVAPMAESYRIRTGETGDKTLDE